MGTIKRRLTLGDLPMKASANEFNLIRITLAALVLVSHAYSVKFGVDTATGFGRFDPTVALFGQPISTIAVDGFFFASGFLVYASVIRNSSAVTFGLSRAARLLPGLWTMLAVTTLVGMVISSEDTLSYLQSPETAQYVLVNATLLKTKFYLPGVFDAAALPKVVNASLWTLPFEAFCYAILIGLSSIGLLRHRTFPVTLTIGVVLWAGWFLAPTLPVSDFLNRWIANLHRLAAFFALGAAAFHWRHKIRVSAGAWTVLIALFAIERLAIGTHWFLGPVVCYSVMLAAFPKGASGAAISGYWDDASYGVYIYGFFIQQMVALYLPQLPIPAQLAVTVSVLFPIALLSWRYIEHPVLERWKEMRHRRAPVPA